MDFPGSRFHLPVIHSQSAEALGQIVYLVASGTWPSANRAIFVPFTLSGSYRITSVWWVNGTTAAGNVDCGVYTQGGARLGSCGSTAQSGTSAIQSAALSLVLPAGSYYMALASSSTSATFLRSTTASAAALGAMGAGQMASALPLPSTATISGAPASAYLPLFGITSSSVI